jgi:hypothetical protein
LAKIEYRTRPTKIRGCVDIYATLRTGSEESWKAIKMNLGDLPAGVLVGTVEITDCIGKDGDYEWHLAKPIRAKRLLKPKRMPQPAWFYPFSAPEK